MFLVVSVTEGISPLFPFGMALLQSNVDCELKVVLDNTVPPDPLRCR